MVSPSRRKDKMSELSSDAVLYDRAQELYKKLGGVGNSDARIIRALLEKKNALERDIIDLRNTIRGLHADIGLAHEAAHERMKSAGIEV